MRLTDLIVVEKAAKLIRDKFDIDFAVTQCSREIKTTTVAVGVPIYLKPEPELKIESIVVKGHGGGWIERIDVSYLICGEDLEDGSLVDELIGEDLKKHAPNMRQVLKLAFILYDGIRYGLRGNHKKAYMDKGWLPRVVCVQRQSYMAKAKLYG